MVIQPEYALSSAMFFYMLPKGVKPSMHDVTTGCWTPSSSDLARGLTAANLATRHAMTTMIINGGLECNADTAQARNRFKYYLQFAEFFDVEGRPTSESEYVSCATMQPFDSASTGADAKLFYARDWSSSDCTCKPVSWDSNHFRALDQMSQCQQLECGTSSSSSSSTSSSSSSSTVSSSSSSSSSEDIDYSRATFERLTVQNLYNYQVPWGGFRVTHRCGATGMWSDANDRCGVPCAFDGECPSGQSCFRDLQVLECYRVYNQVPGVIVNMGACETCTKAPSSSSSSAGSTSSGGSHPTQSSSHWMMQHKIRCGRNWSDANSKCLTRCQVDGDCPWGQKCFRDLTVEVCRRRLLDMLN